jgi:hypothetical protein
LRKADAERGRRASKTRRERSGIMAREPAGRLAVWQVPCSVLAVGEGKANPIQAGAADGRREIGFAHV